jgi:hypothetical protein
MKKLGLPPTFSRTVQKVTLVLLLISLTSCEMLDIVKPGTEPSSPTNPDDNNPTNPVNPGGDKTHYSDYANFNPADYPILNESGKSDSEIAWLKDILWLCYAEREDIGEWTANYIKSNKIKTILSNAAGANAWIYPDQLDRIYLGEMTYSILWGLYDDNQYNDNDRANMRKNMFGFPSHETMHLVQYKSGAFNLMKGMRPDICAAVDMLTEYLAWFYTETRVVGTDITIDMKDAVERQSEYMISSTDPWSNQDQIVHVTPWFNNNLNTYAQHAFIWGVVRENAMTPPLRQASKEDMLKVARAMLACRDPNKAGVTDEALWTVFDALCEAAVGNSKYLRFSENGSWGTVRQDLFDDFQAFIAEWDAAYAAQARGVTRKVSVTNLAAIVW